MLNEALKKLEDDLEVYDMILLAEPEGDGAEGDLTRRFLSSQIFRQSEKKVLILSAEKNKELAELYYTYEFSDKVRIIGGDKQHGDLLNLIDSGLITEQEAFELILR